MKEEDAQYYIEDVRKKVIDTFTYDKVYKQGFNINTPINLEFQKIPLKKVAIELNQEIIDKKKISKIFLKKDDKIEIVHFIGGG